MLGGASAAGGGRRALCGKEDIGKGRKKQRGGECARLVRSRRVLVCRASCVVYARGVFDTRAGSSCGGHVKIQVLPQHPRRYGHFDAIVRLCVLVIVSDLIDLLFEDEVTHNDFALLYPEQVGVVIIASMVVCEGGWRGQREDRSDGGGGEPRCGMVETSYF